jgi:hypothetical protein
MWQRDSNDATPAGGLLTEDGRIRCVSNTGGDD